MNQVSMKMPILELRLSKKRTINVAIKFIDKHFPLLIEVFLNPK